MSEEQSAIKEVRDQISLDYADEAYLNIVSSNLGISRPPFGFSDKVWRALVKAIALQYKQIKEKFRDALAVLFGPDVTQPAVLSTPAYAGQTSITLVDTTFLPQVGTVVLDEGLATEETLTYDYIDRYSNVMYLEDDLVFDHLEYTQEVETSFAFDVGPTSGTTLPVVYGVDFPATGATLVIGRGTSSEEVAEIAAKDEKTITLTAALANTHKGQVPTAVQSELSVAYAPGSFYLQLEDTSQMPVSGTVLLGPSSNNFTVVTGAVGSLTVAASTFSDNRHIGSLIVFEGNVTAALANVVARVLDNGTASITFLSNLGSAPAAGDRFKIRSRVPYARNDYEDSMLILKREIPEATYAAATEVELLKDNATVALAPVQVKGGNWAVIQTDLHNIELYLPSALQDEGTPRSASFIHTIVDETPTSTTVGAAVTAGDTSFNMTSVVDFPIVGVLTVDTGGPTEERVPYYAQESVLVADAAAGATSLVVLDSTVLPSSGSLMVDIEGSVETVTISANNTTTNTLTISALVSARRTGAKVRHRVVKLPNGAAFVNNHSMGEAVDLYQPSLFEIYTSDVVLSGNYVSVEDTFPGPYTYDPGERAAVSMLTAVGKLSTTLAGPTVVATSQVNGKTGLEVEKASFFPLSGFPVTALVGEGTGNREVITISDVNLRQRAGTTVATGVGAGVTSIEVASLTGASTASDFPNVDGYRVILDRDGANEEIVYVIGTAVGPARLLLSAATVSPHVLGETVYLQNDVLSVTALADVHTGIVPTTDRTTHWPTISSAARESAETVRMLYSQFSATQSGFPTTEATVLFNFGQNQLPVTDFLNTSRAVGNTTLPLVNSDSMPTIANWIAVVSEGKYNEEWVTVTVNNTGTDILNISHGLKFAHASGDTVTYYPGDYEVLEYSERSGTTFRFSPAIVLQSNHQLNETMLLSAVTSDPVDTGYDFPLRMPTDLAFRLSFILDLIRAAGVKVTIIEKR